MEVAGTGVGRALTPGPSASRPELPDEVRARGYDVLSDLFLRGGTSGWIGTALGMPVFEECLDRAADADALAAEHFRTFVLDFPPYASACMLRGGRVGGAPADRVSSWFRRLGRRPADPAAAPDHLGHELQLLAAATRAGEADLTRDVLREDMLWWVPLFVAAARRGVEPLWQRVLDLTLEAVLDHAAALDVRADSEPPFDLRLPPDDPLADPEHGLRDVAAYLASPAHCGAAFGVTELRRIGRRHRLPAGFGGRRETIDALLRSAAEYDAVRALTTDLRRVAGEELGHLRSLEPELDGHFVRPWRERFARLDSVLDALRLSAKGHYDRSSGSSAPGT